MCSESVRPESEPEDTLPELSAESDDEQEWHRKFAPLIAGLVQTEDDIGPLVELAKKAGFPVESASHASDNEINAWCPGGSVTDGICRPPNNPRVKWMENYHATDAMPVSEMILPGTHHSGFDKKAPQTPSQETCQDVAIYEQLMQGVRVFDLRVQFFSGNPTDRRFAIFHSSANGRYVKADVLDMLRNYRSINGAGYEIVILDFHEFKNFNTAAYRELADLIKRELGDSIIPRALQAAAARQLTQAGMNTVVAWNGAERDPLFWGGVNHRWIGNNTPNKDEMGRFIQDVGRESKPFGQLKSIQAAYYTLPFYVPKDLSGDLMGWFAAGEGGKPIDGHYIINSDWSLRQRLIDNIMYANGIRYSNRGYRLERPEEWWSSAVDTNNYGMHVVQYHNHVGLLRLLDNTSGYASVQMIHNISPFAVRVLYNEVALLDLYEWGLVFIRMAPGKSPEIIYRNVL